MRWYLKLDEEGTKEDEDKKGCRQIVCREKHILY